MNGRRVSAVRLAGNRTVIARLGGRALRSISLATPVHVRRTGGGALRVTLRGRRGKLGTLEVRLSAVR